MTETASQIIEMKWEKLTLQFNAFHTVVLKINLLKTIKHNKYISHRLQGVLYKIQ